MPRRPPVPIALRGPPPPCDRPSAPPPIAKSAEPVRAETAAPATIGGAEVKTPPLARSNAYDPKWSGISETPNPIVHAAVQLEVKAPPTESMIQESEMRERNKVHLAHIDQVHHDLIRPKSDPWASISSASTPQQKAVATAPYCLGVPVVPSKAQLRFASTELRNPENLAFARVREAELHNVKAPPANIPYRIRLADRVEQSEQGIRFASREAERMVQTFQLAYKELMLAHLEPIIRRQISDRQRAQPAAVSMRPMLSIKDELGDQLDEFLQSQAEEFAAKFADPERLDDGTVKQPTTEELWQKWVDTGKLNEFTQSWMDGTATSLRASVTHYKNSARIFPSSVDVQRDLGLNIRV